jgi:hypothetical protein
MHKALIPIAATLVLLPVAAAADPASDATAFVTSTIEKLNAGDGKGFIAAHEDSPIIVDEFGQHVWSGPAAANRWWNDFTVMSHATGMSNGRLEYGKPLQATSDGNVGYVVLPTTYRYVQKGTKMTEPGNMTFVIRKDGAAWKIASWTYSGGAAVPDK